MYIYLLWPKKRTLYEFKGIVIWSYIGQKDHWDALCGHMTYQNLNVSNDKLNYKERGSKANISVLFVCVIKKRSNVTLSQKALFQNSILKLKISLLLLPALFDFIELLLNFP